MRDFSENMRAHLNSGATRLCRCWLVKRRDGVTFGFTDHDSDLTFDGDNFKANSGMDASVIEASTGLSVDNAQAIGALSADAISEPDILAGKFDSAEVYHWQVDWQDVSVRSLLFRGSLGEVRRANGAFEVELRGIAEDLNHPIGRSYLRECDRVLGDAKCSVDVDDPQFSMTSQLTHIEANRRVTFQGLEAFPDAWFVNGSIVWNDGAVSVIKADSYDGGLRVLELWEETRNTVRVGDSAKIIAGCDKRTNTCRTKFQNLNNFRGFPHMPGEDFTTAYPSTGETNDGQSRNTSSGVGDA